ncbi:c-type cytochrome [Neisseria weaveri]|uniref:Cytochrome n=1 Tax=Neisseria weaveri TaxID=28091 RepID=A0A3S5A9H9_9NEIS|nr:c-type cytochrome [Neisseria weaveri]EGV36774.1 cytochrome c family protein [Neisseria weaveri ATCC 51223]EGV38658.1 cytochrome c family protein [Neisseria weaveri LMG 5135]SAY51530.1 cytochrome precursor [Neisseria weaveri]VEJ50659.1 cytochrome precursor [Neisseria weaveri]
MKRFTLLALAVAAGAAYAAPKADLARGKEIATTVCASCHAADGNSGIAMYPKLSAQHAKYIYQQTVAIKDGKRTTGASAAMAPMVANLTDQDIVDVAAFYAKQFPKPGETNPKDNPELGAKIFRGGIAEKKIPACMSCHGPNGAGIPGGGTDIVAYPRVGGQHKAYIVDQMKAYKNGQRTHTIMVDIAKRMSDEEVDAVANFIQGLH